MSISPELLALLAQARFDPDAKRGYDLFAGGFFWSDEFPAGYMEMCVDLDDWSHRMLINHRTEVILCLEVKRFQELWADVERALPDWPGLRPERRDPRFASELLARAEQEAATWDALDARFDA